MLNDLPKVVSEESLKHFGSYVDALIKGKALPEAKPQTYSVRS